MEAMRLFSRGKTPKLGQHLLTSRDIARAVVEAGGVKTGDAVLEIGPGKGMLTRELLAAGAKVVAIEKDPAFVDSLRKMFANEIRDLRFAIYEGDVRDAEILKSIFAHLKSSSYKLIANIPYYITGELLRLFLTAHTQPETIALLVQKEVAERIARSDKESILSLSVKAFGEPHYTRTVKAGSFNPPPKVDSAILSILGISRVRFTNISEKRFFELLRAGFGQKRKRLLGNLKRHYGPTMSVVLEKAWKELALDENARAEDIPLDRWFSLARTVEENEPRNLRFRNRA